KIHMGFLFSNDRTLKTGTKMMHDALHFSYCMEYLLDEEIDWANLKSEKFIYLVPHDSLLTHNHIETYFNKLQHIYSDLLITYPHLSYLGERPDKIFNPASVPSDIDQTLFKHCFQTEEVAISQDGLKNNIKAGLIRKGVETILNEHIYRVSRITNSRFSVETNRNTYQSDLVINCLWENQTIIDQQLGILSRKENNLRLKFGIISKYIDALRFMPSVSMVSGPYGDFVNFPLPKDRKMYFSWYPVSRHGMVVNQQVPEDWISICNGNIDKSLSAYQFEHHEQVFRQLFSRSFHFNSPVLIAGMIVANGKDDINYINSTLHQRNEEPIFSKAGYYTISTGKYTSAPHNAFLLKNMLPA
ncbi:MAG: hypothetical protein ABIR66_02490, partial [Saprospiraceae bacterium]